MTSADARRGTPTSSPSDSSETSSISSLDADVEQSGGLIRSQLANIIESSDDAIISKDLNGIIVSWNRGAERLFGYAPEEAVGKSITMLIPAELLDEEPHILDRIRHGERIDHFETTRIHRDGSRVHISLTVSPVRDSDGRIVGASKIARNIGERRTAETRIAADLHAMSLLRQVGELCVTDGDKLGKCLHEIVDAAIAIAGADKGNIQLFDALTGQLTIAAQRGFDQRFINRFGVLDPSGSAYFTAMKSGERVIIEDVTDSPMTSSESSRQGMLEAGARACVSTPLISSSLVIFGMLSVHFGERHRPDERELRLLDLLVRQCSDYLERRRADAALVKRAEEQSALYNFTNRLFRADSLSATYDAALDAILGALHCSRASILRFDDTGTMRFVAWRGLSDDYRAVAEGHSPWSARDTAPEPVCIDDAAHADVDGSLKQAIEAERIGALAFVPIEVKGRLAGKFMAYYDNRHIFRRDEIDLAVNLARQLGFAIERLQAEHARRVAEQALRKLSESLETEVEKRTRERDSVWAVSDDLLGVSNFEGHFVSINPAWSRLLGWSEDEIKAMHVSELRHPDDSAQSAGAHAQLAEGVIAVRLENRFRHKDGTWRWVQWTMSAQDGLIYVAGRNVTQEKESAAALERAQVQSAHSQKMEALGQLTGGVAHDFNNLLMVVSGHAQSLKRRVVDPKNVRAVEAILLAATQGESLTRQLLSFSRRQPLSPMVINVSDAVHAVRHVLSGSLNVNVEFAIDIPASAWPIRVDKSELELALVNLAVNARDAMPDGGQLSVTASNVTLSAGDTPDGVEGEFAGVTIADTGTGIPEDVLPRIFEPFFTTKTADKGTGLGLSQVYGFARRSGGTVAVTSKPGKGTRATIYLPRCLGEVDQPEVEDGSQLLSRGGELILVVEDNHNVRTVAVAMLEELGYRTIAVDHPAAAMKVLESGRNLSLLFTDVVLPGDTNGLMLARTIRARRPELPIVLTTGYTKDFGSDTEFPVLRKPYQIAALGRVMREALDPARTGRPAAGTRQAAPSAAV